MILFLRAEEDFESLEVAENIEPNDLAPSDRAENIDFIDRPDSDLNEANEIVSPDIEPRDFRLLPTLAYLKRVPVRSLRFCLGEAIISGSA